MTSNFVFALPVIALGVAWLVGVTTLSRGGAKLARRGTFGLFAYGAAVVLLFFAIEGTSLMPRWISGSEGYGVIIPLAFAVISLLAALLTFAVNAVVFRKHGSNIAPAKDH